MNILVVSIDLPYPLNDGARIRNYHVLQALMKQHTVHLITMGQSDWCQQLLDHLPALSMTVVPSLSWAGLSPLLKLGFTLRGLVSGLTPVEAWLQHGGLEKTVVDELSDSSYDLVLLESTYLSFLGEKIKGLFDNMPIVMDAHNVEHIILQRLAQKSKKIWLRLYHGWYWKSLRRTESQINIFSMKLLAVSEVDKAHFQTMCPGLVIDVVPNGVDEQYFKKVNQPLSNTIVFCGMMSYRPNEEGILWFVDQVWPTVKQAEPEARLIIVGKDPSASVRSLVSDNRIEVTGTVDDVRPYLESARLVIVPLLSGGGTRLKVVEAMAMEKVVVSTRIGAEGISASPGIILADSAELFSRSLLDVYKSTASSRHQRGRLNRRLVKKYYSWEAIGILIERSLRSL
jgi:glycosyltransferase involved in cell wall biosynthesis